MHAKERMRLEAINQAKDRAARGDHCRVYYSKLDEHGRKDVWFVRVIEALPPKNSIIVYDTREITD